jgi:assimilatory nitrate reductase catalytic subunit
LNESYVEAHTTGLDSALASAQIIAPDIKTVAARTGLTEVDIGIFVDWFINTEHVVTCYSQGVNQSAQGSDKVNAILNCHLATGRIGKVGSGPLSLTGQPNAMGGREVGGLANMLATHMGYSPSDIDRVRRFWAAPNITDGEGLKAVQMFEAIERGEIKALWVMHTNPAVTLPRANAMRDALKKLDLFIVSEAMTHTDTTDSGAHVLLPAATWGEKDGTVTNSERRISRQRSFLPMPEEAKPDWEHIALVAQRMGFAESFTFDGPAAIFREHAALSGFENEGARDFDIGAYASISDPGYNAMRPFLWPHRADGVTQKRFFADGAFFTPDKRGKLMAIADPLLAVPTSEHYPFILNTGRVRDHWHTMTRTGKAIKLARHIAEPMLAIHSDDARSLSLVENGYVGMKSKHGTAILRVTLDDGLPQGSVFAPFHWSSTNSGHARVDSLVQPNTDPFSGQPESKATPVQLKALQMTCEGMIISRRHLKPPDWLQHTRITISGGEALLFASNRAPEAIHALLLNHLGEALERVEIIDKAADDFRNLVFQDNRLEIALFVQRKRDSATLEWLIECLARDELTQLDHRAVLAGYPATKGRDMGPLICSCFAVRRESILDAASDGARTVEAIGYIVKARTNCGSCKPEIKIILGNYNR